MTLTDELVWGNSTPRETRFCSCGRRVSVLAVWPGKISCFVCEMAALNRQQERR